MDLTLDRRSEERVPRRGAGVAHVRGRDRGRAAHHPVRSGDTREGFAQHLDWERKLFDDRWAVVSWPRASTAAATRRCGSG